MLDIILFESGNMPTNLTQVYKKVITEYSLPIKRMMLYQPNSLTETMDLRGYNLLFYSAKCGVTLYKKLLFEIKNKNYKLITVLLLEDSQSLNEFALPTVCPNSVLLVPIDPTLFLQTIEQCYEISSQWKNQSDVSGFQLKHYGESLNITYEDIYFFEGFGKKIALKTRSQEIQFYSTFDELMLRLPTYFIRCHKGFVVNSRKIYSVQLSEMKLKLSDQSEIPFSRSYRDSVRKYIGGETFD
jgi:two-component system response regulator LytT